MALTHTVKHPFVSLKSDGGDSSLVQPTDWNAEHQVVFTAAANVLLGRGETAGPVQELPLGAGFDVSGGSISVAFALPVGMIVDFGGNSPPPLWLLCDGTAYSTSSKPLLFAAIGYAHGGGSGSFNVPDLRGRASFGRDSMGGAAANRVTEAGSEIDGAALGASGGQQNFTLTALELPAHRHAVSDAGNHIHYNVAAGSTTGTASVGPGESIVQAHDSYTLDAVSSPAPTLAETSEGGEHNHVIGLTGGGEAHTNMPPALMLTKIIYAGE